MTHHGRGVGARCCLPIMTLSIGESCDKTRLLRLIRMILHTAVAAFMLLALLKADYSKQPSPCHWCALNEVPICQSKTFDKQTSPHVLAHLLPPQIILAR
jgi:hypothetical protein